MDLMLIVSPTNAQSPHFPYYYLFLAGYLEQQGFQVTIVDPHFETYAENVNFILSQVRSQKPRYIGLSCFVTDYNRVHDLAVEIKKLSNATLLVGNAQPSIAPGDFLFEGSPFDIVVRGEGELTVKEILTAPNDLASLRGIDGIAFLDASTVVMTNNRKLMSLSDLGMPAYHLLDMSWYQRTTKYLIRRLATVCAVVYTGRGCPYNCNFCASNVVWHTNDKSPGNPYVRSRPLNVVMDELALLQNIYGYDFFYILDDTFGIRESTIVEFCNAYKNSGLKMLWAAETRVSCMKKPEIVQLMKDSGCIQLDFGVESGSPKVLSLIDKKINLEQIVRAFDICNKVGMRTFANMLLNMPQEDEADLELSHKMLERIRPTYISTGLTQPYPGTSLYHSLGRKIDKKDYHLLDREFPPEEFRLSTHKIDLQWLLYQWQLKYRTFALFERSLFAIGMEYWKHILLSKNRLRYLGFFIKEILKTPLSYLKIRYTRRHLNRAASRHLQWNVARPHWQD